VILIGNLTDDPELRYTQNGVARTRFSIAVNRRYRNREGNLQEETTFVPIVVWGPQAENCANYLGKGRSVAVDGRLRIETFETEEGERRKVAEVVAETVQFLGGGTGGRRGAEGEAEKEAPQTAEAPPEETGDEEVPF
jgi:single-strand DNA-binding protein